MKYIKLFEEVTERLYWEVNTRQPYFELSLKKIGVSPEDTKELLQIFNDDGDEDDWILLFRDYDDEDDKYAWEWSSVTYEVPTTWGNPKFMGKIVIEDWEVDANRYNV